MGLRARDLSTTAPLGAGGSSRVGSPNQQVNARPEIRRQPDLAPAYQR